MIEEWQERAACEDMDVDMFFAVRSGPALSVCRRCPVVRECRAWADRMEGNANIKFIHGVFGGETRHQRVYRRQRVPVQPARYRVDYDAVAGVYKAGGLPGVQQAFDISYTAATQRVCRARKLGSLESARAA